MMYSISSRTKARVRKVDCYGRLDVGFGSGFRSYFHCDYLAQDSKDECGV